VGWLSERLLSDVSERVSGLNNNQATTTRTNDTAEIHEIVQNQLVEIMRQMMEEEESKKPTSVPVEPVRPIARETKETSTQMEVLHLINTSIQVNPPPGLAMSSKRFNRSSQHGNPSG
jgi:hypothetical protein